MAVQAPSRKVGVGLAVTSLVAIVVWAVKQFANVDIPAHIAVEGGAVLNFIIQYLVPNAEEPPNA